MIINNPIPEDSNEVVAFCSTRSTEKMNPRYKNTGSSFLKCRESSNVKMPMIKTTFVRYPATPLEAS
jgi:hypothetical protein